MNFVRATTSTSHGILYSIQNVYTVFRLYDTSYLCDTFTLSLFKIYSIRTWNWRRKFSCIFVRRKQKNAEKQIKIIRRSETGRISGFEEIRSKFHVSENLINSINNIFVFLYRTLTTYCNAIHWHNSKSILFSHAAYLFSEESSHRAWSK